MPKDKSAQTHLARILAVDAIQQKEESSGPQSQLVLSDAHKAPPASTAQHVQQEDRLKASRQPQAWQDSVAYLAPALAFNLGLQYELWPLMPRGNKLAPQDQQALTPAAGNNAIDVCQKGRAAPLHVSSSISLTVKPLRQDYQERCTEVTQSGTVRQRSLTSSAMLQRACTKVHDDQLPFSTSCRQRCQQMHWLSHFVFWALTSSFLQNTVQSLSVAV